MLIATWVLASATSILAIGGLATVAAWLGARRTDRIRQQQERESQLEERVLEKARKEFLQRERESELEEHVLEKGRKEVLKAALNIAGYAGFAVFMGLMALFDNREKLMTWLRSNREIGS